MTAGIKTIIYPVRDLAKAKALYSEALGLKPTTDQPYYVGFTIEGQEIGLDPGGHGKGLTGPIGYCNVEDIRKSLEALLAAGAQAQQEVTDVGGGKLIAAVKDVDGNVIGLIQSP